MTTAKAFAAQSAETPLAPWSLERRDLGPKDVRFDIAFGGVCHSDLHQIRNEWGGAMFPMVPGHEIVGTVAEVGTGVSKFKPGDKVGVGCLVDSCRRCSNCQKGLEQYCENGHSQTYNDFEQDGVTPTYGGYSSTIVVHEDFVLRIPDNLDLAATAPLLCAGITTYSPLRHWKVGQGQKVGVIGLGGLGHMAVKFAAAFGAEVTVLSTSEGKRGDAERLGAHKFVVTSDKTQVVDKARYFDFILDTVSAEHDYNMYLHMLKADGVMVCVGAPPTPTQIAAFSLIPLRRTLAGSMIGGLPETQEMLDFCGRHGIVSDIELIAMQDIMPSFERMLKGDVRYRFVIDMKTL